jgi:hypothetical protein
VEYGVADVSATAMAERATFMLKYHAQARRYLYERDRLEEATENELTSLADSLRYEDFRRHVKPYERARNHIMSRWLSLQVNTMADMPKEVKDCIAQWNELIASEARKFGFEPL